MLSQKNLRNGRLTKRSCAVCGCPIPRKHRKSSQLGVKVYCLRHATWKRPNKGEIINDFC